MNYQLKNMRKSAVIIAFFLILGPISLEAPLNSFFEERALIHPQIDGKKKVFSTYELNDPKLCQLLTLATFQNRKTQEEAQSLNNRYLEAELIQTEKIRTAHIYEQTILRNKIERTNQARERIQKEISLSH